MSTLNWPQYFCVYNMSIGCSPCAYVGSSHSPYPLGWLVTLNCLQVWIWVAYNGADIDWWPICMSARMGWDCWDVSADVLSDCYEVMVQWGFHFHVVALKACCCAVCCIEWHHTEECTKTGPVFSYVLYFHYEQWSLYSACLMFQMCHSYLYMFRWATDHCLFVCVFWQQDDVQKGGAEDVQQWEAERPVGEESSSRGWPVQTRGRMERKELC